MTPLLLLALLTPIRPLKPWTPDICRARQARATDDYLGYCRIVSPGKHPDCPVNDSTGYGDQEAQCALTFIPAAYPPAERYATPLHCCGEDPPQVLASESLAATIQSGYSHSPFSG